MSMILRESDCLDDESKRLCQETCKITFDNNPVLEENDVVQNYKYLLNHFGKINQRFMLIIDEFDSAKIVWKNKISYFEGIRDSVQYPGFFILVSRRPLEVIEMDSYGSSCFYKHILRIQCVFTYFKRLILVPKWVLFLKGSLFPLFLPLKSLKSVWGRISRLMLC